jgi:hypothetical protein
MRDQHGWNRREFLRGAGVAIGLPFFPSLFPGTAWAEQVKPPTRLMFMAVPLGFVPNKGIIGNEGTGVKDPKYYNAWFPEEDGLKYKMPDVHAGLEPYREHISFLKGLSNRKYRGETHYGDDVFLTCADTFADPSKSFSNTVSCDQVAASFEGMGGQTPAIPAWPSASLRCSARIRAASRGQNKVCRCRRISHRRRYLTCFSARMTSPPPHACYA